MNRWTALPLVLCLTLPVFAQEEKEEKESPAPAASASAEPAASPAASTAAAPSPAASAAPSGAAVEAAIDEYIALLTAKNYKGFVERMSPPDDPARKKPDWAKDVEETAKVYATGTPKDQADMMEIFTKLKGKEWKFAPDGKSATVETTGKDATGKEIKVTTTMVLTGDKWYMKM